MLTRKPPCILRCFVAREVCVGAWSLFQIMGLCCGKDVSHPQHGAKGHLNFISQKVFVELFCKSRFPYESVHLSFIGTKTKSKLTDLHGN